MTIKNIPESFKIDGVPYFRSELYPYYCSEASTQMVYKFFCKRSKLTQEGIENRGVGTYDGGLEGYHDKGSEWFFRKAGFEVEKYDKPEPSFIKELLYKNDVPIMMRLIGKMNHWNHTVVVTGYDKKGLITHDPDVGSDVKFSIPNRSFDITSALVVRNPSDCRIFRITESLFDET